MAVLVIADHDNASLRGHHPQDRHRRQGALGRRRRAGAGAGGAKPAAKAAGQDRRACARCCWPRAPSWARAWPRRSRPVIPLLAGRL